MQVVAVDPQQPRQDRLDLAAEVLLRGGVVALPTETFYGLAADASNPEALLRVNRLKGKPDDSAHLLLVADAAQVLGVAAALPAAFATLTELFWPGPLTLVIRGAADRPVDGSAHSGTVAVRVPGLALPRRLAGTLGRPITGVSANRHKEPPCRTAREVAEQFPQGLDLILDGGPTPGGQASTILDLTGARPTILREGLVPVSALRRFLEDLDA